MNVTYSLRSITLRLIWRRSALLIGLLLGLNITPTAAQLIHTELSGPITGVFGDASLLGNDVALGSPLHLSFTYETDIPLIPGYSSAYLGEGGNTLGSLSVGDFSFQIPRVRLEISPDTEYSSAEYPSLSGDLIHLYSTDTPVGQWHVWMSALLLYPKGTITSVEPIAPPPGYVLANLTIYRNEGSQSVSATSLGVFGDLEPFTPVPEAKTMSGVAALVLLVMIALRGRSSRTAIPSELDGNVSS